MGSSIVAVILVLLVAYWLLTGDQRKKDKLASDWRTWPTLPEYLEQNPRARTPTGPACRHCNARHIHEYRWGEETPSLRIHRCRTCNETLYRSSI